MSTGSSIWVGANSWWLSRPEFTCHCRRYLFSPWVRKILWRRKQQPTLVLLPGKSHGQRGLECNHPWGCIRVGHNFETKQQQQLANTDYMKIRIGMGNQSKMFQVLVILGNMASVQFSSVAQSGPTLKPRELQHARPPCPSLTQYQSNLDLHNFIM